MFSNILDRKLYIEYGPTNLEIEVTNDNHIEIYQFILSIFKNKFDELAKEKDKLKRKTLAKRKFNSEIGKIMQKSTEIFLPKFITPMAAVAGSLSESLLNDLLKNFVLDKIYINNGGDVAVYSSENKNFTFSVGKNSEIQIFLEKVNGHYGVATSGWKGRSFSLGIADSVTVVAKSASIADAAATMIANDINIDYHPNIKKKNATIIYEETDLKNKLITTNVGFLNHSEIKMALNKGKSSANILINKKIILSALLNLKNNYVYLGKNFKINSKKKIKFLND